MSVIKVKLRNTQRAKLLTPTGGLTGLRIHAMTGDADRLRPIAKDVLADNATTVEWVMVVD